ncbi:MAG: hypothetical protein COX79_01160 [Candidatus Levybacteria bacterium CG_4_10_14_0_2_um_filter_36_16]|nr:MAG: hypothetical protein AUK12_03945 [Candidatus Levybacteria bacterium CG2_30_37_29]PIZ97743.1 MAG: hypothetical protein COX79_01160 [Candidatus Levybacteria bacterium CG_4_10_14_0_2_um_filter_36_16]PJA90708.1 MAG: hypothetical protein CO136_01065 [Candidatus Levybacteria bacterium CG_4_9_14_3_um_filter_36_7]
MLRKRTIEQIVRSFSNHRRIAMLCLLDENPELSVSQIAGDLKIDIKLASFYLRKLTIAGLIMKKSNGKFIRHKLTKRGVFVLTFIRTLE